MNFLSSILPTLFVLGVVIIIHEFGHFLACRLTGVKVEKFSIGFGPEIFRWKGRETTYAISAIPFGGFIKPSGESASELGEAGPKPGDYLAAKLWVRIFIVTAGVLMNYLLGYLLFASLFMVGRPVAGTTIDGFVAGYPAASSGLLAGDRIVGVNGMPVKYWEQMTSVFQSAEGPEYLLTVVRMNEAGVSAEHRIAVSPKIEEIIDPFGNKQTSRLIGIRPDLKAVEYERYGAWESFGLAAKLTLDLAVKTHQAIFYLLMGKMSVKHLAGPVGIMSMAGRAARHGFTYLLDLTAILSISLAVINLLPIPALDGGHLLFLLIEAVRRKKVSLRLQERFTQVGFTLLIALMLFVIYNDLVNLGVFERVKHLFSGN